MFCKSCGNPLPSESAKFCAVCGAPNHAAVPIQPASNDAYSQQQFDGSQPPQQATQTAAPPYVQNAIEDQYSVEPAKKSGKAINIVLIICIVVSVLVVAGCIVYFVFPDVVDSAAGSISSMFGGESDEDASDDSYRGETTTRRSRATTTSSAGATTVPITAATTLPIQPTVAPAIGTRYKVNTKEKGNLLLRSDPSISENNKLDAIPFGSVIIITEVVNGQVVENNYGLWGKTTYNGKTGYVYMGLLTPVTPY